MRDFIKKGFTDCSEQKWAEFADLILKNFKEVTKLDKDSDPMADDQSLMNGIVALTDLTSRFGNRSGINLDKGILFIGNPGTGKTSLMKAYVRAYDKMLGIPYLSGGRRLHVMNSSNSTDAFNPPFMYGSEEAVEPVIIQASDIRLLYAEGGYDAIRMFYKDDDYNFIPFLIIDDLTYGLSASQASHYGHKENPLNYVITQRANNGLLTFATANEIEVDPNNPFFSRMAGMFNIVSFNGKDHRI